MSQIEIYDAVNDRTTTVERIEKTDEEWKKLLTDKGYMVVSELAWKQLNAPEEIKQYFKQVYPPIKTIDDNLEIIKKAGYKVINHFVLPKESWWTHYYIPIEAKLPTLKQKYKGDKEAAAFLASQELEIEMYRKYSDYYGYGFFIMQKT